MKRFPGPLAMRRAASSAALLLSLAAPVAAQTAPPLNYQWVGVNLVQFPALYIDWTLGQRGGTEVAQPVGASIHLSNGTPSGGTIEITFRDVSTSTIYCRIGIAMPDPNGCVPQPPSSARCTVLSGGMGGGMCQMTVQFNN